MRKMTSLESCSIIVVYHHIDTLLDLERDMAQDEKVPRGKREA